MDDMYAFEDAGLGFGNEDFMGVNKHLRSSPQSVHHKSDLVGNDHQIQGFSDHGERSKDTQHLSKDTSTSSDKWKNAFREVAAAVGFSFPPGRDPDILPVVEAIHALKKSHRTLQDDSKSLRKREAVLQIQLADRNMEAIELRRELHSAWQGADPSIIQLKQLMLDPAVNKEFQRLKSELEETQKELKRVQEELEATTFTQDSKTGRLLMAKCRNLQEENDEMGRELSEGKVHQLEVQLGMAREYAEEMRRAVLELEDHCHVLDTEAEELQKEIFALRRQLEQQRSGFAEREVHGFGGPGPREQEMYGFRRGMARGGGSMDRKRPPEMDMGHQRFMRKRGR